MTFMSRLDALNLNELLPVRHYRLRSFSSEYTYISHTRHGNSRLLFYDVGPGTDLMREACHTRS